MLTDGFVTAVRTIGTVVSCYYYEVTRFFTYIIVSLAFAQLAKIPTLEDRH
jgi:hypothetical protein